LKGSFEIINLEIITKIKIV